MQAALTDRTGADLALQVAFDDERQMDVQKDCVPQGAVRLARDVQLGGRNPDTFIPDTGCALVVASYTAATDVGVMTF